VSPEQKKGEASGIRIKTSPGSFGKWRKNAEPFKRLAEGTAVAFATLHWFLMIFNDALSTPPVFP